MLPLLNVVRDVLWMMCSVGFRPCTAFCKGQKIKTSKKIDSSIYVRFAERHLLVSLPKHPEGYDRPHRSHSE